jgi:hypothetical protein
LASGDPDGRPWAAARYSHLGATEGEILANILFRPWILMGHLVAPDRLFYMLLLVLPVLPALRWRLADRALPAMPALGLNLLSAEALQRDLILQYAIPIFPFLLVWAIDGLRPPATLPRWLTPARMKAWSVVAFLALAKFGFFWEIYPSRLPQLAELQHATRLIPPEVAVLCDSHVCPHVRPRQSLDMSRATRGLAQLAGYQVVVLDARQPGWQNDRAFTRVLLRHLRRDPAFRRAFGGRGVYVFTRWRPRA